MVHRIFLAVPILALFAATGIIFLAARAPRTWAAHWAAPRPIARASGQDDFGVVHGTNGDWDLLWIDDNLQQVRFTEAPVAGAAGHRTVVLDQGDVLQPSLLRIGHTDLAVWIHNHNGSTDLMAAWIAAGQKPEVFRLLGGPQPIEHPDLFRGYRNTFNLVFSWQRYNNFDLFLTTLPPLGRQPVLLRRLTHAQYYSFDPRAVTDRMGNIDVLHLESCCRQQVWNLVLDRFNRDGVRLAPGRILYREYSYPQTRGLPPSWGEDFGLDPSGNVWGAFSGGDGAEVFMLDRKGRIAIPPASIDRTGALPTSLSLVVNGRTGYLLWQQPYDLGSYIDSQEFDTRLAPAGGPERVSYEAAADSSPAAFLLGSQPVVVWQSTQSDGEATFEDTRRRSAVEPSLAQRLGLGLGNPWEDLAVLVVTSAGIAAITTTINILIVFGLALLGFFGVKLLSRVPGKWALYGLVLGLALYLTFVSPGGPTIVLTPMPSMGLRALPFGLLAAAAAAAAMTWLGVVALRRIEDVYRAGLMALTGVYFFAFVEAIVFIQQRLGYI